MPHRRPEHVKTLVLAEKPSVGRELARVLGCTRGDRGFIEGDRYVVTWAMGHLVELADPADYDERWKTWSLDTLPMLPQQMKHRVIHQVSGQFRTVKSLFGRKDVGSLVIATDAGREGELVARWAMLMGGWKGPVQRLWISSQTDAAIAAGFAALRPGKDYENLFHAAECRSEADWLVGLNVSRALSCRHDARLSAGRVQTPTLAMIAEREREIQAFVPVPYWTVQADFGPYSGSWRGPRGETRIGEEAGAEEIVRAVRGAKAVIREVTEKEKSEPPPPAFDLGALQTAANASLGFPAKRTLDLLQGLYERHKILTYPRTDSRYISADVAATLPVRLRALAGTPFGDTAKRLAEGALEPGKRFVDDAKVSDHHALIPTEEPVRLDRLTHEERALWELVVRRFLAVLSPPYRYRAIGIVTEAAGHAFVTRGTEVVDQGWRAVDRPERTEEGDGELPEQRLGRHSVGETLAVKSVSSRRQLTKPPARYTDGALIAAMETAGRRLGDEELRKSIQACGIGTAATRAEIIEKLLSSYYIERRGKELAPTSRGLELVAIVPEELRSAALTAQWELRLARIAAGTEQAAGFSADIRKNTAELVRLVKSSTARYQPKGDGSAPCPLCGKSMLSFLDRRGKKVRVCQSLSCGYEEKGDGGDPFGGGHRASPRERAITRKLIHEYSDDEGETATLGDMLKARQKEKPGGG
jgi:DNA topoisomerase III